VRLGCRIALVFLTAGLVAVLTLYGPARGQQVHRNSFENRAPAWVKGQADAKFTEVVHEVTDQTAHTGQWSEHLQVDAERGSYVQYLYNLGRAPLSEDLDISLWVKANRPGVQFMARLVLPHERKPGDLNEPLTTMLRGERYQLVNRWERLELRRPLDPNKPPDTPSKNTSTKDGKTAPPAPILHGPLRLAKDEQQLLRAELGRDVDFTDAYIDQLVLNVYSGPGLNEVWIDDIEAGPVYPDVPEAAATGGNAVPGTPASRTGQPTGRTAVIELNRFLMVNNKRFFFRGIRHTGTPLNVLRDAGFNCVWLDPQAPPALVEEALNLGLWLVPTLPVGDSVTTAQSTEALNQQVARFLPTDAVLFWDLGGGRTMEESLQIAHTAQAVHALDPQAQRPVGVDVWDGYRTYSRDPYVLVGAHRWPLMTSLELPQYREWLIQRRRLANPGAFQWTWVQTHLPEWYTALVYDRPKDAAGKPTQPDTFNEPVGPQPEQIRLLAYTALAAGCQGLGFYSDRFLADSHQGRDRLLQLALLNQELQMLEPLLLSVVEPPAWIETSKGDVKAAVFRTERGVLVLPMWSGTGAQYVPGQAAFSGMTIIVPQVPGCMQAWEITPGEVRSLQVERVAGGTKVTVPEFGLTTAIVFTSDNGPTGLVVRFQDHARRVHKLAAQWAHDLAEEEIRKVLEVETQLEAAGHVLPDGAALQDDARKRLKSSADRWKDGDFREAYHDAQRALRPLRILMRAQWEMATRSFDLPTSSPYAVSFYTLPRHWQLVDQLRVAQPQKNILPDGDFEALPSQALNTWMPQEVTTDDVELKAWRVTTDTVQEDPRPQSNNQPGSTSPFSALGQSPVGAPAAPVYQPGQPVQPGKEPPKSAVIKPQEGQRFLKLEIKPKDLEHVPAALERTFLAINSAAVHQPPGTLVRISAWVRIPKPIKASVDGVLFYDSAGGEPLAVRLTDKTDWRKYTLYRRVPASGTISVTLALTGIGLAYFDDVRIEPMLPDNSAPASVQRTGRPRPGDFVPAPSGVQQTQWRQ
jgi:hypothetical protein